MAFKGSNGVAVERRVDLASLLCMIGRHGPAVALAVFAVVSVLAGFVIYRTVRGKRRRKTDRAEEEKNPPTESDESVTQAGLEAERSAASTEVTDEDSLDVKKEHEELTETHPEVRQRRAVAAAAERETWLCSPPQSDIQAPVNHHDTSPHTRGDCVPSFSMEANVYSTVAEIQEGDADVRHFGATDDGVKDEEVPKEQVWQEWDLTTDEDIDMKKSTQEGGTRPSSDTAYIEQTLPMGEYADHDKQDNESTLKTERVELILEEHVIPTHKSLNHDIEDVNHRQDIAPGEGRAIKVIQAEEEQKIDRLNNTPVNADAQSQQLEHKEDHSLTCNQETVVLLGRADAVENGQIGASSEDKGGSSLQTMVDDLVSRITSDAITHMDQSANDQQSQKVEVPTVDEDGELPVPSDQSQNVTGMIGNGTTTAEVEAPVDDMRNTHVLVSDQSVEEIDNNATSPDTTGDTDPSVQEPRVDSAVDTDARDKTFHEDIVSSSQDQHNGQNYDDFSFVVIDPAAHMTLPLFELRDNDMSCGVGEESGISSMAVSPEMLDPGNNLELSVMAHEPQAEQKPELPTCLFADVATLSVMEEVASGMGFDPQPDPLSDRFNHESLTANQDLVSHEVGDQQAEMPSDVRKNHVDMKVSEGASVGEKMKCSENKDEDYAKTEISIMEATMDHNEWITDGNQHLPWMNISLQSFSHYPTTTHPLPTEECSHTDPEPPSVSEVKQINGLHENTGSKNVRVTFRVHYLTHSPFQTVAVTGSQQELGNWKGFIPLERAKDGHWVGVVSLPAESHMQWKFVVVDKGAVCRWEECGNRLLDTGCDDDLLVHKWWGFL
ncbi:uncharacterized protein stbd1 [Dunckerocampus dactyliophorus]|uniref:uncharacterized protein stbd1 n=1 Tax=Dunckerocampus dactyliophorus TaxID=161453 RepID=UPI002405C63C|nr:uncharacterized protein stbd1 [Dunckerocampus dactyliophorus]